MITSVFARRALLAAAVSATASLPQSQALFADGPSRTASANPAGKPTRAASYDPGSVNGELQRLFNEGGPEHAVTPRSPKRYSTTKTKRISEILWQNHRTQQVDHTRSRLGPQHAAGSTHNQGTRSRTTCWT